jgi:hypothetical protein
MQGFNSLKGQDSNEFGESVLEQNKLCRRYNCYKIDEVKNINSTRTIPESVVEVGELVGLIYRSDKDSPGKFKNFIHFMETPPKLISDIEGKQLYLMGGAYQVTENGIEG